MGAVNRRARAGARAAALALALALACAGPAGAQGRGGRRGGVSAGPPAEAVISPDGRRAAWASADGHEVWTSTRAQASGEWTEPNRALTIRGSVQQIVFSPDGSHIAFANPRTVAGRGASATGPNSSYAFIATFDFVTRTIRFIEPTFDVDSDPSWSADGKSVTFTRQIPGHAAETLTRTLTAPPAGPPATVPANQSFTLAGVLGAPFIDPPVPSGDGTAIAYSVREGPDRSLYLLRTGSKESRRLADFPDDDGQEITQVAVSKTGAAVAWVRGEAPNGQGDVPNPNALPDPPEQQVWIVGTDGQAAQFVGLGSGALFTPDDGQLLYNSAGGVQGVTLSWGARGQLQGVSSPHQFFAAGLRGMRFSPDGTRFLYQRGQGIEVYDLATRTDVAIPHEGMSDAGAVWAPDSRHIAFRRQPAPAGGRGGGGNSIFGSVNCGNYRYCGPERSDQPWSIWVADVDSMAEHKVWAATAGAVGSVYYPLDQSLSPGQHGDEMFWSAGDRIAFVWEGDGWRHLYAVPAAGGAATLLTPGDGEVESAAISLDRHDMVYATNIGDLGRRHVGEVAIAGRPARALTHGDEDQWAPAPLAGGAVGYVNAGWAQTPAIVVRKADGGTDDVGPAPAANYPKDKMLKPELVSFPASDGETAYGQLFVPAHPRGCAVIFSHGGIRRQMLPGFHYMEPYSALYEMNQYLASRGCVVLSVEYRSSIMRGEAFRNAPGWGFAGNSELKDFVGAAHYLLARPDVHGGLLGIYGLSWGGYMTANALTQHGELFKVGFDMAGVHSSSNDAGVPYSAMAHLDTLSSPLFLAQGDDDRNVSFSEGIMLARTLQADHPQEEFLQRVMPGEIHDLNLTFAQLTSVYQQGANFLLGHLGIDAGAGPGN